MAVVTVGTGVPVATIVGEGAEVAVTAEPEAEKAGPLPVARTVKFRVTVCQTPVVGSWTLTVIV